MDYERFVKKLKLPAGFKAPTELRYEEFPFWQPHHSNAEMPTRA